MLISSGRSASQFKMSVKAFDELKKLLDLEDRKLYRNRTGRLIRDNFRRRGWLKGRARGKAGGFNRQTDG
jgi:hypothetical protein